MLITEIITENCCPQDLTESRMVWRKSGNKVVKGARCTGGPRQGRVVSNASQCGAPVNVKKRMTLKKTKARFGKRLARKARRSKRINPTSKRLARMNRSTSKRR